MNTNTCSCGGTPHTDECYFGHFLAYTGFAGESPEIIEKLKKAYFDGIDAGRPHDPEKATGSGELPELPEHAETWPEKICLQQGEDAEPFGVASEYEVTWCQDWQNDTDIPYVRADIARQAIAQCGDRRDAEFQSWLADRLVHGYGEKESIDLFMEYRACPKEQGK